MTSEFYTGNSKFYVSTDCIIFGFNNGKLQLLIRRRDIEPGYGQWSLMGGFVKENESVDEGAKRTLHNLTGLQNLYMQQVGAFGSVDRDPGDRVVSVVYYALINTDDYDDKLRESFNAVWTPIDSLPELYSDHKIMVLRALELMQIKFSREPLVFELLPQQFTLTQLQTLYEAVYGNPIDKRNFRKRVADMEFIEKTGNVDKTSSKRGAALYRFNNDEYNKHQNFKL